MDAFSITAGSLSDAYASACDRLERLGFAKALWNRSLDVWTTDTDVKQKIANRLGWLGALDFIAPQIERLKAFAASVQAGGFSDVVLLGMGGSSLAPEVLRRVIGVSDGYPRFRMLDSVDPDAVRAAMENAGTSLFILASKSGTTIEPNVMAAEARRRILAAGHRHWGPHFVAVTDEGTALHKRTMEETFRDVFVNPSDIGGRYSALSYFGMVPAAVMGVDLDRLVLRAREMENDCRGTTVTLNPGLALGALMAAGAQNGRDKLTLFPAPGLESFGLWVEQLVAESTGKSGIGVVPIAGEQATPGDRSLDRVAVIISLGHTEDDHTRRSPASPDAIPTARLDVPEATALGAEFLRWEVATAAAGVLLGINPFDEPNVQQAKDATRALLSVYIHERRLPTPEPAASIGGARLSTSRAAEARLNGAGANTFLRLLATGDYFCVLAYLPPDDERFEPILQRFRNNVGERTGCATMFGYGPRYLHSTGQLHKGGPNTGVFIVLTAEPHSDLDIPDEPFSFGVLEMAQALGDFKSLDDENRRALYVHLPRRDPEMIRGVADALLAAL